MDQFAKWVLALTFIIGGFAYIVIRVLRAMDGAPDEGPLRGWGPVLAGLGAMVIGVLIIIF